MDYCPVCKEDTEHDVLASSHLLVIQCSSCQTIRKVQPPKEPDQVRVKTIVSREDHSSVCFAEFFEDEVITAGDRIVAECPDGEGAGVEVMSIEVEDRRVQSAEAPDITTLWTRVIDMVVVRISVHDGKTTIPLYVTCTGDEQFVVGELYKAGTHKTIRYRITHIKNRDGSIRKREGKYEPASKIKRIYGFRV
ncbi:MAG: hypothetical protein JXA44_09550 [Methanospirillaceae archaeon]|nr:hypothetical protein [Methanospirillaceae archaeon]